MKRCVNCERSVPRVYEHHVAKAANVPDALWLVCSVCHRWLDCELYRFGCQPGAGGTQHTTQARPIRVLWASLAGPVTVLAARQSVLGAPVDHAPMLNDMAWPL